MTFKGPFQGKTFYDSTRADRSLVGSLVTLQSWQAVSGGALIQCLCFTEDKILLAPLHSCQMGKFLLWWELPLMACSLKYTHPAWESSKFCVTGIKNCASFCVFTEVIQLYSNGTTSRAKPRVLPPVLAEFFKGGGSSQREAQSWRRVAALAATEAVLWYLITAFKLPDTSFTDTSNQCNTSISSQSFLWHWNKSILFLRRGGTWGVSTQLMGCSRAQ